MSIFNYSNRQVRKILPWVKKIEAYRPAMRKLTDAKLQAKTTEFKGLLAQKKRTLDDLLPEAFAVVREAARRVLGMEPYRVQLIGGILLYQGRIAEMKTGEGKTLVAAMPSYLMALEGKGAHVVTVNDYLAQRDAEEIGQVHRFLGLTVGCVLNSSSNAQRREAYACDITYVTNHELGFDYLRDNMATKKERLVQRGLHYAIIDEVDSILIDEARTPLIISGGGDASTELYVKCDQLAKRMKRGESNADMTKMEILAGKELEETGDFIVDEKDKLVHLTNEGVKRTEAYFDLENFADVSNIQIQHHMNLALKARYLMFKDQDYVVSDDGQILIVDEFTGRILPGRRFSDGLHQAIEAKEGVEIRQETQTLATITFQNFFNQYDRKSGMTGTAMTEAAEFKEIYSMDVVEVPTNRPVVRVDEPDEIYFTKAAKYEAVIDAILAAHEKNQPVLVGTVTIEVSEQLSQMLHHRGIDHQVLNAKQHAMEAEIISHAGEAGAVTIATNMAGRGTDIKLDEDARAAGGLFVIGTERHESRRIDNQLRGRSGRQGDPGRSKFYLSMEDDLLRLFMSESVKDRLKALGFRETDVIQHKMLTKAVENAQKKLEGNHFGIRKALMQYDEVNHKQREWVYGQRRQILNEEDVSWLIRTMMNTLVDMMIKNCCVGEVKDWNVQGLSMRYGALVPAVQNIKVAQDMTVDKFDTILKKDINTWYERKEAELGSEIIREAERIVLLRALDRRWVQQLDDLEQLRQAVGLVGYGQKDPVIEYKMRAFELFQQMQWDVYETAIGMLLRAHRVEKPVPAPEASEDGKEEKNEAKPEDIGTAN